VQESGLAMNGKTVAPVSAFSWLLSDHERFPQPRRDKLDSNDI